MLHLFPHSFRSDVFFVFILCCALRSRFLIVLRWGRKETSGNIVDDPSRENIMTEKLYWEKLWQSDGEDVDRVQNRSGTRRNSFHKYSKISPITKDSIDSKLRRSLSFSSPSCFCRDGEELIISFFDLNGGSPSRCVNAPNVSEHSIPSTCLTSERLPRSEKHDLSAQRTRTTLEPNQNKFLNLYIDREQERGNNQRNPPYIANGGCLVENRVLINSGWPPRVHSTAPSSPTHWKDKLRSQSFNDEKDLDVFSIQNSELGDSRSEFPTKIRKRFMRKLSRTLGRRSEMRSRDYDSETTTTVEDIYEDTSELQGGLYSDGSVFNCGASDNLSTYKINNGYCSRNGFISKDHHHLRNVENEEDTDKDLSATLKEAEERVMSMTEIEIEPEKLQNGALCMSILFQLIKDINQDRKNLAQEVLTQVQHRIAERKCSRNAMKQANIDFDNRLKRLEKEKSELQSRLEKELDRRSSDWSSKLEKLQAEESRLRDRVRKLAEQNVSLQREVFSLSGREVETRNRIMNLETQLNDMTERLEDVKTENQKLQQALLELRERSKSVEADRDCIATSYRMKKKENKELQSIVVKFQRICSEHEETISGLTEGCTSDFVKQSPQRDDLVSKLQLEQIRLCGVEQTLRREAESYRQEMETLRHENRCLLDRLKNDGSGCQSFFKLEHEMSVRLKCLQDQGLSLIYQNYELCQKLLDVMKSQQVKQDIDTEFGGYYIVEYNAKFEGLKRGIENFKRSLQTLSVVLDEKSHLEAVGCQSQPSGIGVSEKWTSPTSQDNIELELKAESLLTKVLREKLCSQVLEIEQLQEYLASSLRCKEKLNEEIHRLEDGLFTLSHKAKDMEIQMVIKDENLNKLKQDFEECTKELDINRDALTKVSKDRDVLWEEVKRSKEMEMLLHHRVDSSKKKIKTLEEDILLKEGQITILKDSLANQSSDNRYTWNAH